MKKSQVTLFIIFAIVILVIFSVFIVLVSSLGSDKSEIARTIITESDLLFGEFESYFQMCLSNALDDALFLLGRQGGFIFEDQKGSIIDFPIDVQEYNGFNVTKIVLFYQPAFMMTLPGYPCLQESAQGWPDNLRGNNCLNNYSHNMPNIEFLRFGNYQRILNHQVRDVDVPLCSRNHYINFTLRDPDTGSFYDSFLNLVCSPTLNPIKNSYSIEEQIKGFINYQMEECYLDSLQLFNESDIVVRSRGDFEIVIDFSDEYTVATAYLPILLDYIKADTLLRDMNFFSRSNVRIKTLYSILYGGNISVRNERLNMLVRDTTGLIDLDMINLTFDIEIDSYEIFNRMGVFNISVERIPDVGGSFIRLLDRNSYIRGSPYEYYVFVGNRYPALDNYNVYGINNYEVYLNVGDFFMLSPLAYDPDDELLIYSYEILNEDWKWRQDYLDDTDLYFFGMDETHVCIHPKYGMVKNRCTGFLLNESDAGSHRLKISVKDSSGAEDYQIINIFVDIEPEIKFRIENIYGLPSFSIEPGITRYIVSREDPFIINSTGSISSGPPIITTNQLMWRDSKNSVVDIEPSSVSLDFDDIYPFRFRFNNSLIVHPGYDFFTNYSFLSDFISNSLFLTNAMMPIPLDGPVINYLDSLDIYYSVFNISYRQGYPLRANSNFDRRSSIILSYYKDGNLINESEEEIYIVDCVAYHSDIPAYPFNLIKTNRENRTLNHFMANHTCCDGDPANPLSWKYKPHSAECYYQYEIGDYETFMLDINNNISVDIFKKIYPGFNVFNYENNGNVLFPKDLIYDRYVRILSGECSGDRGNICVPKEYSILKIPYCGQTVISSSSFFMSPNHYNRTVGQTLSDVTNNPRASGYYDGDLCSCFDSGSTRLLNTSDPLENGLYCCFDSNGLPYRLSDKPCVLQECARLDINCPTCVQQTVGATVFSDLLKPGPYCYCSEFNPVVDTRLSADGNKYCCNSDSLSFFLKNNLNECNLPD
ncbi:MAG: hypothetical protein ACMXYG_07180 [Candidatus Woesearchaeota archaeon]